MLHPAMTPADRHRIIDGTLLFFEQVGALPADEPEPEPTFRCPVCDSVNDWQGPCDYACYAVWTAPPADPRDYIDGYGW